MIRTAIFGFVAALLGYALYAFAQSSVDVRPTVTPAGTSSSNGVSFAWFYSTADRRVYVCRAGIESKPTLDCSATAKLP